MFYWSKIVPGKVAACDDEMCVTYGELAKLAAEWLYPGRVLFAASSSVRSLAALMGLLNGGGTVALIDPDSTPEDLKFYIDDFAPDVVAGDVEFIQRNREALRDVKTVDISQSLGAGGSLLCAGGLCYTTRGLLGEQCK